jgi:hypothetical protein
LKIKQRSKKKKHLGKIIALVVLAGIVAAIIYSYYQQKESEDRQWKWVTSGPFSINKNQYELGENIFMVVSDLKPTDVGEIDFVAPNGYTYNAIPFNGTMKSSFKQFFTPNTQGRLGLCNAASLVGHWNILFKGVLYKSIPFEIINEYIPHYSNTTEGLDTIPKGVGLC